MKKHHPIARLRLTFGVLLIAAALAPFGFAQTQPPAAPVAYRVQVIQPNPGMTDEWRQFYQTEILPALKKGGVKQRFVWATNYGDVRTYVLIAPVEKLAEFDEPGTLNKILGAEAAHAINKKQGRLLAEWRQSVAVPRPDLSIPATLKDPKLAISIKHTVSPGRNAEYEKWVKENLLVAGRKAESKGALAAKVVFGGDPNEYHTYILVNSYADMVKLQAGMAKAAAEMNLSLTPPAGVVTNVEVTVVRAVPELSISPAAPKAGDKE